MDTSELINRIQRTIQGLEHCRKKLSSGQVNIFDKGYRNLKSNLSKEERKLNRLFKQLLPKRCESCLLGTHLYFNFANCNKFQSFYISLLGSILIEPFLHSFEILDIRLVKPGMNWNNWDIL